MNFLSKSMPVAAGTLAIGLSLAPAAKAATQDVWYVTSPGDSCQLSIPTTDTKFRPKATGGRNESTSASNFVICPLPDPTGAGFFTISTSLYSIDGASHDVTCTAVSNWFGNGQQYSSKTLTVATSKSWQNIFWNASDFGGLAGNHVVVLSITCLLPPQTAVNLIEGDY